MEQELKKHKALKALYDQEGGKHLVASLLSDVHNCVERLSAQYKTMEYEEFVALGAELSAKLSLARELTRSEQNVRYVEQQILEGLQ